MSCILHTGSLNTKGYGRLQIEGRTRFAHRVAYCEANGLTLRDIEGKVVCHRCDNPPCINPDHLFLGTHADNQHDRNLKGRGPQGSRNGRAAVDPAEVFSMRERGMLQRQIAAHFGVTQSAISKVLLGRSWA
jgi:hypothetical protein